MTFCSCVNNDIPLQEAKSEDVKKHDGALPEQKGEGWCVVHIKSVWLWYAGSLKGKVQYVKYSFWFYIKTKYIIITFSF